MGHNFHMVFIVSAHHEVQQKFLEVEGVSNQLIFSKIKQQIEQTVDKRLHLFIMNLLLGKRRLQDEILPYLDQQLKQTGSYFWPSGDCLSCSFCLLDLWLAEDFYA